MNPDKVVSQLLDEIYLLRIALALEADRVEADLDLKSFPTSRRAGAEEAVEQMRAAARGQMVLAYPDLTGDQARGALRRAGAEPTLTLPQWETEQEVRRG